MATATNAGIRRPKKASKAAKAAADTSWSKWQFFLSNYSVAIATWLGTLIALLSFVATVVGPIWTPVPNPRPDAIVQPRIPVARPDIPMLLQWSEALCDAIADATVHRVGSFAFEQAEIALNKAHVTRQTFLVDYELFHRFEQYLERVKQRRLAGSQQLDDQMKKESADLVASIQRAVAAATSLPVTRR